MAKAGVAVKIIQYEMFAHCGRDNILRPDTADNDQGNAGCLVCVKASRNEQSSLGVHDLQNYKLWLM